MCPAGTPVHGGPPRTHVPCAQDVQRAHQRSHCVRRPARCEDQLGEANAQRQEGDAETDTGARQASGQREFHVSIKDQVRVNGWHKQMCWPSMSSRKPYLTVSCVAAIVHD